LTRIVRLLPPGDKDSVIVDKTGKRSGRGAYLCQQRVCWETALARRQLERTLKVAMTTETIDQLREYAAGLPQLLTTEPEEE